jgi:hypothetical protein
MIYSDAFDALPASVKQDVYQRMLDRLTAPELRETSFGTPRVDRHAIIDILRDTKPDFPR